MHDQDENILRTVNWQPICTSKHYANASALGEANELVSTAEAGSGSL